MLEFVFDHANNNKIMKIEGTISSEYEKLLYESYIFFLIKILYEKNLIKECEYIKIKESFSYYN